MRCAPQGLGLNGHHGTPAAHPNDSASAPARSNRAEEHPSFARTKTSTQPTAAAVGGIPPPRDGGPHGSHRDGSRGERHHRRDYLSLFVMVGTLLAVKSVEPGHAALRLREKQIPSKVMQLSSQRLMAYVRVVKLEILGVRFFFFLERSPQYLSLRHTIKTRGDERKVMKASSEAERENLRLPFDDLLDAGFFFFFFL